MSTRTMPLILNRIESALTEMNTADAMCDAEVCMEYGEVAVAVNVIIGELEALSRDLRKAIAAEASGGGEL